MLPHEWPPVLSHDPAFAMQLLTAGVNFEDPAVLEKFLVDNAKRMGTAGKILFPIPNRRLSKRLYRLRAETLIAWGRSDKLIGPAYGERWAELLPKAKLEWFDNAGHLLPYETPEPFVAAVAKFLG
ncbi:MAG: alpha/beta hydrolase [Akkermansiaceae bacterium]|nr:alpha/beta hydrolase [Akkermansiaceae bacterium]